MRAVHARHALLSSYQQDKVEGGPKFVDIALKGSIGDNEAVAGVVVLSERLLSFDWVFSYGAPRLIPRMNNQEPTKCSNSLTDDHVHPFELAENRSVLNDVLICDEQNLELNHLQFGLEVLTLCGVALICL